MHYGTIFFLDKTANSENWRRNQTTRADALKKAQNVIGFTGGNIDLFIQDASEVKNFAIMWRQAGRKTCDVRVRKDLMFGTRDDQELSERECRVLLGLYSAIGAKPYVKVGWLSIQCRAAGWLTTPPTTPSADDGFPPPKVPDIPCGPIYSRGQVERTLSELLARNLVACVTYRHGERYWSNRSTREELWKAVENRKLHRAQVRAERAAHDAKVSEAIKRSLGVP
jgi:hypothetical protein